MFSHGATLLHPTAQKPSYEYCVVLLTHGADVDARDKDIHVSKGCDPVTSDSLKAIL